MFIVSKLHATRAQIGKSEREGKEFVPKYWRSSPQKLMIFAPRFAIRKEVEKRISSCITVEQEVEEEIQDDSKFKLGEERRCWGETDQTLLLLLLLLPLCQSGLASSDS